MFHSQMSPHFIESIIGGLCTAIPLALIGWLQGRDVRTRLVLKVEEHDKDISQLQAKSSDHGERIVRLETATKVNGHAAGRTH